MTAFDTAAAFLVEVRKSLPHTEIGRLFEGIDYAIDRLRTSAKPTIMDEIVAERTRQIAKGYTAEHDDEATDGEIGQAAGLVLLELRSDDAARFTADRVATYILDKHPDRREQLIIALALGIAEIERLDRAKEKA